MNIFEFVFILQLLAAIGIFFVKIYNVMSKGRAYDQRMSWIYFSGYLMCVLLAFIITMVDTSTAFYGIILKLEAWLVLPQVFVLLIELFYNWEQEATRPLRTMGTLDKKVDFSRGIR